MGELAVITPGATTDTVAAAVDPSAIVQLAPQELALIDAAVVFLNGVVRDSGLQLAVAVSAYVVNALFGGDTSALASPDRTKQHTYRTLCDHPELQMGANTLRRLVRIGLQVHQLPPDLAALLTPAQHRALLVERDIARKGELARQALANHWGGKELAVAIAAAKPQARVRRGRPAVPELVKHVNAMVATARIALAGAEFAAAFAALGAKDRQAVSDGVREVLGTVEVAVRVSAVAGVAGNA